MAIDGVLQLDAVAEEIIHENFTCDTRDHEDHTFCGVMFDVGCESKLPGEFGGIGPPSLPPSRQATRTLRPRWSPKSGCGFIPWVVLHPLGVASSLGCGFIPWVLLPPLLRSGIRRDPDSRRPRGPGARHCLAHRRLLLRKARDPGNPTSNPDPNPTLAQP